MLPVNLKLSDHNRPIELSSVNHAVHQTKNQVHCVWIVFDWLKSFLALSIYCVALYFSWREIGGPRRWAGFNEFWPSGHRGHFVLTSLGCGWCWCLCVPSPSFLLLCLTGGLQLSRSACLLSVPSEGDLNPFSVSALPHVSLVSIRTISQIHLGQLFEEWFIGNWLCFSEEL